VDELRSLHLLVLCVTVRPKIVSNSQLDCKPCRNGTVRIDLCSSETCPSRPCTFSGAEPTKAKGFDDRPGTIVKPAHSLNGVFHVDVVGVSLQPTLSRGAMRRNLLYRVGAFVGAAMSLVVIVVLSTEAAVQSLIRCGSRGMRTANDDTASILEVRR
jgi:hypothetical protein